MKELLLENLELIFTIVTMAVTYIFGKIAKKSLLIKDERIPIQNITIAIIMTLIYYAITGEMSAVVASGSPIMTLIYDTVHNIQKEIDLK